MENLFRLSRLVPVPALQEHRLLKQNLGGEAMNRQAPAPETQPSVKNTAERKIVVPSQPEKMGSVLRREAGMRQAGAQDIAARQRNGIQQEIQRNIDTMSADPNTPKAMITQYLKQRSEELHKQGLHAGTVNGRVVLSTYVPPKPVAASDARRNERIEHLKWRLYGVEREIANLLREGVRPGTRTMQKQRYAAMNPRNVTRDVNEWMAGMQAGGIAAYGPRLQELYLEHSKLTQAVSRLKAERSAKLPYTAEDAPMSGISSSPERAPVAFQGKEQPVTSFDLQKSLETMEPKTADAIRSLDSDMQAPAARMLESASEAERQDMVSVITKLGALDKDTLRALGKLSLAGIPTDEKVRIAPDSPEGRALAFLRGLTPQETIAFEKMMRIARDLTGGTESFDLQNPEMKRVVQVLVQRWKTAKTQADKDMMEGLLYMKGVDVDASDLEKGRIMLASKETKFMMTLIGILLFAKGMIDKFGGKKELPVEKKEKEKKEKNPAEMKPEERAKEVTEGQKKIKEMTKTEADLAKTIEEMKGKLGKEKAESQEKQTGIEKEMAQAKKRLAELIAKREKEEERVKKLKEVPKKVGEESKEKNKEKEAPASKPEKKEGMDPLRTESILRTLAKRIFGDSVLVATAFRVEETENGKVRIVVAEKQLRDNQKSPEDRASQEIIDSVLRKDIFRNADRLAGRLSTNPMDKDDFQKVKGELEKIAKEVEKRSSPNTSAPAAGEFVDVSTWDRYQS